MSFLFPILWGILERGCIGSFVGIGVYMASRLMKFDDFSLEGTYGLGGALGAWVLLHHGNPWLALVAASLGGAFCGSLTGLLHTKLGLNRLIAGIAMTTMLFSLSLNINGANVALENMNTIFSPWQNLSDCKSFLLFPLCLITALFFVYFMKSESGYILRSTGINEQFVTSLGKNVNFYIILCLALANGLSAFAGGLFVQYSGFYSVFGNVGTLISALAGCMIAELFEKNMFIMAIVGSCLYQLLIAVTLELQIEPSWQKLITGLLIVFILFLKKLEKLLKTSVAKA